MITSRSDHRPLKAREDSMAKAKISLVLRLLAVGSTAAAIGIMVTSHATAKVLNLSFDARYNNTPAFVYFVVAEAVAGGYSLVSLFLSSKSLFWRAVMMMDVVIAMLPSSSIFATVAIGRVGKKGNNHAGWLPICGQVPKFCDRVIGALIVGFVAAAIYLVLLLCSLHSLFALKP
ncbi:CASP-like protein 1C3 [Rhodamnia argentea]|uniref:CASP-like protein n=1 Tax=Rhodamnia argentea TaxID=178133 RepID=A0ABM3HYB8_9MYRT|nr:CASP-like protein 1C3 [Rhodamnia argentea]